MELVVQCPGCERKMRAPESVLGKSVQCPQCGRPFTPGKDAVPEVPIAPPSLAPRQGGKAGPIDWSNITDDARAPAAPSGRHLDRPIVREERRKKPATLPLWAWIILAILGVKLTLAAGIFCFAAVIALLGHRAEQMGTQSLGSPEAIVEGGEPRDAGPKPRLPREVPALVPLNLAGPEVSPDWQVVFRSHDPSIWGKDIQKSPTHMARPLSTVADDIAYLRLRKGSDYVIVRTDKLHLTLNAVGRSGWHGANNLDFGGCHLGVFHKGFLGMEKNQIALHNPDGGTWFSGWGFGHIAWVDRQGYCWAGQPIPPQIFEIAVKSGQLTLSESESLLTFPRPILPLQLEGEGVSRDWFVLFRSADPQIWDRDINRGPSDFARSLADAPNDLRYLRIRKDKQFILIPMSKDRLRQLVERDGYGWEGRNIDSWNARHLGVFTNALPTNRSGQINVRTHPNLRGWGFGNKDHVDDDQGYAWDGKTILPTVLEIAVLSGEPTTAERKKLLWKEEF